MGNLQKKLDLLCERIYMFDSVAVAFSGGVDSTLLLVIANHVLGEKVVAVTAAGPNFPKDELEYAQTFCEKRGIAHLTINLDKEIMSAIEGNEEDRCYQCKKAIFRELKEAAGEHILEGSNVDDLKDYRPGRKALEELGIISPLEEAGFSKDDIRRALILLDVPGSTKPAMACLATRVPTGEKISVNKLKMIERSEKILKELGFSHLRVRHHGELARIELGEEEIEKMLDKDLLLEIDQKLKEVGFKYVSLDLAGYKMGNMNTTKKL